MYQISAGCSFFVPSDESGIVFFSNLDYSTTFLEIDKQEYPEIFYEEGKVYIDAFLEACTSIETLRTVRLELLSKNLIVAQN